MNFIQYGHEFYYIFSVVVGVFLDFGLSLIKSRYLIEGPVFWLNPKAYVRYLDMKVSLLFVRRSLRNEVT